MSKLFDYEWSLDEELQDYYVADFHVFRTIASYQKMIRDYPQFEGILRSYLDVDLENHNLITEEGTIGFVNADSETMEELQLLKKVLWE